MRSLLIAAVLATGSIPHALPAQVPDSTRGSCTQFAAASRTPTAGLPQPRAVAGLVLCPNEVGDVISGLWRTRSIPDETFTEVRRTSLEMNDRRIFSAAMVAAEDQGLPPDRRIVALEVLAHYVDPSTGITAEELRHPPEQWVPRTVVDAGQRPGAEPMTPEQAIPALTVFQRLSMNGSPDQVRQAARYLRYNFALQNAESTPLQPGVVTGTWDCRGNLSLRSTADIKLPLGLADSTGKIFRGIEIFPPDATIPVGYPTRQKPGRYDTELALRGPITVLFGGRSVLTLSCR
jgi:hypothetical protein